MMTSLKTRTHKHVRSAGQLNRAKKNPVMQAYRNQAELKDCLVALDKKNGEAQQTVCLLLSQDFDGHLPSLIRRRNPGRRMIVTSEHGGLPGLVSRHDITFRAGMLGWDRLSFLQKFNDAIEELRTATSAGQQVIILVPEDSEMESL